MIHKKFIILFIALLFLSTSCSPVTNRIGRSARIVQVETASQVVGLYASDFTEDDEFLYPSFWACIILPINERMDFQYGFGIFSLDAALRVLVTPAFETFPVIASFDFGGSYNALGNNTTHEGMIRLNISPKISIWTPYLSYSYHAGKFAHWESGTENFRQQVVYLGLEGNNDNRMTVELTYSWPIGNVESDLFNHSRNNIGLSIALKL